MLNILLTLVAGVIIIGLACFCAACCYVAVQDSKKS